MRRAIGRVGSAIIDILLPDVKAEACTDGWCERNASGQGRCCKQCIGGKVCTYWGYGCPGGCINY